MFQQPNPSETALYPLRFEPICQYRLWGGRRLANLLRTALPNDGPFGEAWLLSDRDDFPSRVADGPLQGSTIKELIERSPDGMMGGLATRFNRFPLLLKFLDAREVLSVQVHPSDELKEYLPPGERGKTEAWVVLEDYPDGEIYAGLKPGTTPEGLQKSVEDKTVANDLASFKPTVGDGVFLEAGTVHALGGAVVFEVQQNSDVTFRLYDWDRVDAGTGKTRDLQVDQAIACTDFSKGPVVPVTAVIEKDDSATREQLFDCEFFNLSRITSELAFSVGAENQPRILVCIEGGGELEHDGSRYLMGKGDVMLLPAAVGVCSYRPHSDQSATVLEISLPEGA